MIADATLRNQAFAHRSWCAEHPGHASNERLEFLGDAVLGWVIADLAFRRWPQLSEGKLSDLRKSVVNESSLAEVARGIGLGAHLLLGVGEERGGGRERASILADALEAVIGAVYLDGGSGVAHAFVERLFGELLDARQERLEHLDVKTALQERAVRERGHHPRYEVTSTGPDHAKHFAATVYLGSQLAGVGEGPSKKTAEQAAARVAMDGWDGAGAP